MIDALAAAVRDVARSEILPRAQRIRAERKGDGSLVSEADRAAQAALVPRLAALRACPVIGEEMSGEAQQAAWAAGAGDAWCVDPIDGTTNFLQGLPYFAVSVALLERAKPVLGVVYNPATDELFQAVAGRGAYVNGQRILPRPAPESLAHCVAALELKHFPRDAAARLVARSPWYSYRNYGAAALDWCWMAAGRFDVYLHTNHMLWDYAAGSLVLAEAGGAMCTLESDDFAAGPPWRKSVVAARSPALLGAWSTCLRAAVAGP